MFVHKQTSSVISFVLCGMPGFVAPFLWPRQSFYLFLSTVVLPRKRESSMGATVSYAAESRQPSVESPAHTDDELYVTLWNDPTVCRRVSWLSLRHFAGFAYAVRGAFPELSNKGISFFLLPFGMRWDKDRVRISDDSLLDDAVRQTRESYVTAPLSPAHPTFYVHDDGYSPATSPGHMRLPTPDLSPPAGSVSSSASQRSRQRQSDMRACVLMRDGCRCIFCCCDTKQLLECAHIIDHALHRDRALLASVSLYGTFDAINGMTLCIECHAAFDKGLVCVDARTYTLLLADRQTPEEMELYGGAWRRMSGKPVRRCESRFSGYWPTKALFAYQHERFNNLAVKRAVEQGTATSKSRGSGRGGSAASTFQSVTSDRLPRASTGGRSQGVAAGSGRLAVSRPISHHRYDLRASAPVAAPTQPPVRPSLPSEALLCGDGESIMPQAESAANAARFLLTGRSTSGAGRADSEASVAAPRGVVSAPAAAYLSLAATNHLMAANAASGRQVLHGRTTAAAAGRGVLESPMPSGLLAAQYTPRSQRVATSVPESVARYLAGPSR